MKILIGLSAVQTAILAFVCVRLSGVDTRMDGMEANIQAAAKAPAMITQLAYNRENRAGHRLSDDNLYSAHIQPGDNAELKRFIIAELDRASANIIARTGPDARYNSSKITATVQTEALKKSLENKLKTFVSAGRISEAEMNNFQVSLAKLPARDRRYMLSQLTQAMNSGAVDARF